jgi:DNA-binding transcriptional MocR family regulator
MLTSPAYRALSCPARCLLEEFQRIFRHGRNGELRISTRRASELLGVSEPTASNAFHELASHGFLVLTNDERWQERKTREWRLTFEHSNNGSAPTDEWKRWTPENPFPIPRQSKKSRPKKPGQTCSKIEGSLLKIPGQVHAETSVTH